ncbi:helix-turn-helix domain-containing protein [Butyrivibrio fibrisolvens]|uniref:helix-turn-helix domain-containing protein n=1 Tax=Pseudobutyrivibrio ruminis TaxID=46206 RepID=UPI0003FFC65E|nr:helix-turn-helix domain-containing protein [Pseudobutyrivibrio ruminis]MDC7280009.1 helix-turn-helix domain-containing protein [Butyrivibrio fibrisolvens]
MEAKQKFETIIQKIENLIREEKYLQDKEISKIAFEVVNEVLDERSRNNIFKFLMDKTVIQYISERRMMISYKKLLSNGDIHKTYQEAIDISGTGTAQAFSTKFKKIFGISPKEAFEINDGLKYKARPSWDSLTENGVEMKMENREIIVTAIDNSKDIQNYVRDLKELYSFNDEEAHLAQNLWLDGKSSLKECFQFVADYVYDKTDLERDYRLKTDLENNKVQYLYFKKELNFDQIFRILLLQYLGFIKRPIEEYDEDYLNICSEYEVYIVDKLETLEKKIKYYKKMRDETYTKYDAQLYGFYVSNIGSAEKAFRTIKPGIVNERKLEKYKERFGAEKKVKERQDLVGSEYIEYEFEDRVEECTSYDEEEFDDDGWVVNELERDVYDDNEIYAYDEAYEEEQNRYEEFERACEADSCLSQEEIDKQKTARRPFRIFSDLDVEGYWKNRCNTRGDLKDQDINIADIDGLDPKDMMNGIDDLFEE